MPPRVRAKTITVGTPARATAAASCSGPEVSVRPARQRRGALHERGVEGDRVDRPDRLGTCAPPAASRALRVERLERVEVAVAQVEREPHALGDRRRRPRLGAQRADRRQAAAGHGRLAHAGTKAAAASSGSSRRSIGVAPAWPARPSKTISVRRTPRQPSTAQAAMPASSSTGPCSMCSST